MNKKLLNTQIEALDKEHGAEIVKFYKDNGFDTKNHEGICNKKERDTYIFYGVNEDGKFNNRKCDSCLKTITLEEARQLIQENQYPKVMNVWCDEDDEIVPRVVFMEKCCKYIAWKSATTIEGAEKETETIAWDNAEDIPTQSDIKAKELEELKSQLENIRSKIKELTNLVD